MYPENLLKFLKKRIKKSWYLAFCASFILGLLIHMYRLTNHLLTWDSAYNFHRDQNAIHLGRCFLTLACGIGSFYDLQWVNGLLSLIYLSLVSVCLVRIFSVRKKVSILLICGLTVSFPSVASTFAYMYTADGYFLSMLLMTAAVLLTIRFKKGFLPGLFLVAAAYGSYQAYISWAVMLILTWSALQLLWDRMRVRELLSYWVRFLLMGSLGTALYLICNKILTALEGAVTSDYNGIASMSLPDGPALISAVKSCLIDFTYFFFGPLKQVNLFKILNADMLLLLLLLVVWLIWRHKIYLHAKRLLLLLLCFAAMPFACSIIYFLSPSVRYYMLMYAGFCLIYMLPVLLYDGMEIRSGAVSLLFSWGCVLITALTVFNFALIANISYLYMTTSNEKTFQLISRMTDRIEQLEGYPDAEKLCIIGHFDDYDTIALNLPPAMAGIRDSYIISEQAHFSAVMDTYFGLKLPCCTEAERQDIQSSEAFREMGCWPASDSIRQFGDIVAIKLENIE